MPCQAYGGNKGRYCIGNGFLRSLSRKKTFVYHTTERDVRQTATRGEVNEFVRMTIYSAKLQEFILQPTLSLFKLERS